MSSNVIDKIYTEARKQIANHSIYVWGGSGQLCKDVSESWIRRKEARNSGGAHADEAVKAWREVMASPYRNVARCFDCSGFVSWCLIQAGVLDKRRDCDGLYDRCVPTDTLEDGTLLFRVNSQNPNDETHVGFYFGGDQLHAKGRKDKVVEEKFQSSYWAKYAWFRALPHDEPAPEPDPEPEPEPEPTDMYVLVKGGSVRVRAGDNVGTPCVGIAHRGDKLPLLGYGESGWYMVDFNGIDAFITNRERYTEVVNL